MESDPNCSSQFVVLYQSCPRSAFFRHTAFRAAFLLVFVYSLIAAVISALGPVGDLLLLPIVVGAVMLDVTGVVLGSISLWYRIRQEKERMRDDMIRAGVGGDVEAQIASLSVLSPQHNGDAQCPDPRPRLFLFEYANKRYWCVEPRRDDGRAPSDSECFTAALREGMRRKHDDAIGRTFFAISILATIINTVACSVGQLDEKKAAPVLDITLEKTIRALLIVASVLLLATSVIIPVRDMTGINALRSMKPVPAGLMTIDLSGDASDRGATGQEETVPTRPKYREALPGPPIEELQSDDERNHRETSAPRGPSDSQWRGDLTHFTSPLADSVAKSVAVSTAESMPSTVAIDTDKKPRTLWVWGGFTADGASDGDVNVGTVEAEHSAAPALARPVTTAVFPLRERSAAASQTRLGAESPPEMTRLFARPTAPLAEDDLSSELSSRLVGQL